MKPSRFPFPQLLFIAPRSVLPAPCLLFFALFAFLCGQATAQPTAPKLLPFQGRLTDQNGVAVSNGVRLVQFKIYEVPTGGSPVWAGELHRTTVNGGLVNVLLGSKTPFTGVDFDKQLYLEITVDVSGPTGQPDNMITAADPPMLPRQAILPVVFAKEAADSRLLDGYDWSDVFAEGATNPATAKLSGSRIVNQSITAAQIAPQTITAGQIVNNTITSQQLGAAIITSNQIAPASISSVNLAPGSVLVSNIADGAVTYAKLLPRIVGTNVPLGGYAVSQSSSNWFSPTPSVATEVTSLRISIVIRGGPVRVFLVPDGSANGSNLSASRSDSSNAVLGIGLLRNGTNIGSISVDDYGSNGQNVLASPAVCHFVDTSPGTMTTNTYSITINQANLGVSASARAYYVKLVAVEE